MSKRRSVILAGLSVFWLFTVYLLVYPTQKPFTVETFLAFTLSAGWGSERQGVKTKKELYEV